MQVLRFLLFPFGILYAWATRFRNHLYNIGHKPSIRFEVPVIAVGNLNLGGSGKSPLIEYLLRLLGDKYKVATLSRGYGRSTRGFRFVAAEDTPASVGDEPYLFFKNFNAAAKVAVGEDRAAAIPQILHAHPEVDLILLDDAFQHRSVNPHLNILLTRFARPFCDDFVLPVGYLRESRRSAARADVIIVTKCPQKLAPEEREALQQKIATYAGSKPVFFSTIEYKDPIAFGDILVPRIDSVVVLTGIANCEPFIRYVQSRYRVIKHFKFSDHHRFTLEEIREIVTFTRKQGEGVILLTTEKDSVRLLDASLRSAWSSIPCYYLPIEMQFLENGSDFDAMIHHGIEKVHAVSHTT